MTERGLLHAIDFGTTNSMIIVGLPDGTMQRIADPASPAGSYTVPTSVCVLPDGNFAVGRSAENAKRMRAGAYRSDFKRDFGDATPTTLAGVSMTADAMTVEVLRFLRQQAQGVVPGEPERVLITVPAAWEAGNCELMRSAAALAGYSTWSVTLIPEPVAALAYAFEQRHDLADPVNIVVYDLGGGTFDCAVAEGTGSGHEVLGEPGGLDGIGGAAFNRLVLDVVRDRFGDSAAEVLDAPPSDVDILRRRLTLYDSCEAFKCQLSVAHRHEDLLTELTPPAWFDLHRAEFEALIRPLLAETIAECDRILATLDLEWPEVHRLVPVGGSSRIPLVGHLLAQHTKSTVLRLDEPEVAIAHGAALIGRNGIKEKAYMEGTTLLGSGQVTGGKADDLLLTALQDNHERLPSQRKPNILICGQTGAGKSTTINTLFGEDVANIGHYSRGSARDELYEWESKGHHIDVVDLPGMGDSHKRDSEYKEMYLRRVAEADGFIVVVQAPRPAGEPTLRTVNLLIRSAVEPERIIFAYNRVASLTPEIDGVRRPVVIDGLAGPATSGDMKAVEEARQAFHNDICGQIRNGKYAKRFPIENVVPYDALSGWNLFAVFNAVLAGLPGDALVRWRDAVERATRDLQNRTEKRIRRERAEYRRKLADLTAENERLKKGDDSRRRQAAASDQHADLDEERRKVNEETRKLKEESERLERQERAASSLSAQQQRHDVAVSEKLAIWVAEKVDVAVKVTKAAAQRVMNFFRRR